MKNASKKIFVIGAVLSLLLVAAQEVRAGGLHNVRTNASGTMDWNQTGMGGTKSSLNNGKQTRKKYIAHKRKKPSKSKRSKDRTTSNAWMFESKSS